jgi:hypothetical protein
MRGAGRELRGVFGKTPLIMHIALKMVSTIFARPPPPLKVDPSPCKIELQPKNMLFSFLVNTLINISGPLGSLVCLRPLGLLIYWSIALVLCSFGILVLFLFVL